MDGKAIYWQLYNREQKYVDFFNKDYKFIGVDILQGQEEIKKLFLIDSANLMEVIGQPKDKFLKEDGFLGKGGISSKDKPNVLMKERFVEDSRSSTLFSQVMYNHDSKLIITSMKKDHSPCLRLARYVNHDLGKEKENKDKDKDRDNKDKDKEKKEQEVSIVSDVTDYQANSLGVNAFRVSQDMSHLFTCGKDRCLFIFQFQNIQRTDKHEETLESDLMLVKKDELDEEADKLNSELRQIELQIQEEEESFRKIISQKEAERIEADRTLEEERKIFTKEKDELQRQINEKSDSHKRELDELRENSNSKMKEIQDEHSKTLKKKDEEKKKEQENFEKEKKKDSDQLSSLRKRLMMEEKDLNERFEKRIEELEENIKTLEKEKNQISAEISEKKEELMKNNDIKITSKREELEVLRRNYIDAENKFKKEKEIYEKDITDKKELIKAKEIKKGEERKKLQGLLEENEKLAKQIKVLTNINNNLILGLRRRQKRKKPNNRGQKSNST